MVSSRRSHSRMRRVSEPIVSRRDPRAGKSASGMCSGAKLTAGHSGKLPPKDLTAPRTWFTSCVRQLTSASRERTMAIWVWASSLRCLSGYKSFGSTRARRPRFSASTSSVFRLLA